MVLLRIAVHRRVSRSHDRDGAATLAEADHDVGLAALDHLDDRARCEVVLDGQHEPHHLRVAQVRRIHRGDRDGRDVLVPTVGGERLEASDKDLLAVRIAFEAAWRHGTAELHARGVTARANVQLGDVGARRHEVTDLRGDQRAERGRLPRRLALREQLREARQRIGAVEVEALELAALRDLERERVGVGVDAGARRDDEPELLREDLEVVELDDRVLLRLDANHREVAERVLVDGQIEPRRAAAQLRDRERLFAERRTVEVDHRDLHDRAARRRRLHAQPRVDGELAAHRPVGNCNVTRAAQLLPAARGLRFEDLRVQRMACSVELAVEEVAQEPVVRVRGVVGRIGARPE